MASRPTQAPPRARSTGQRPHRTRRATTAHSGEAPRTLDPATAAWLAVVPAAIATVLAIVVLGPPLGAVLFPESPFTFWASIQGGVIPEPTEQARFLLALLGPVLLAGLTLLLVSRPLPVPPATAGRLAVGVQIAGVAFVIACFVAQWTYRFGSIYVSAATEARTVYFKLPTLVVAAAIAIGLVAAIRSARVREAFGRWTAESRPRAIAATVAAVAITALTLLPAITTNDAVGFWHDAVIYHLVFTFDEAMAVADGRSPLGDFAAQYGSLWPYVSGTGMTLLGETLLVFTLLMATITATALLGVFGMLRRLTRSTIVALLLFMPLLATSAYMMRGPLENRYSLVSYFGTFPLRYAGPFLVLWLTARHLHGAWPRRAWPLFLLAGLAVFNNADFGVAAFGATLAALLWTGGRPTWASLGRLAVQAAIGLAAAIALVTLLLLARTGEAPHFELLFRYSRMFALGGFSMLPMRPVIGVSTLIYLTYTAAIGVATVRAVRGEPDRLLTGALAWSGIFGFGAGAYYMGRSHPEVLTNMLPAWALAVTLLTVVAVRQLAARPERRPALPALACLFAFGVLVCSLAQTPRPWSEVERLQRGPAPIFDYPPYLAMLRAHTEPGERVVILLQLGHYTAAKAGIEDVTPYTGTESIQTVEQLDHTVRTLREEGGSKVFLQQPLTQPELLLGLERHGFRPAEAGTDKMEMWVDTRSRARAHRPAE